jgi:hypothetical protein
MAQLKKELQVKKEIKDEREIGDCLKQLIQEMDAAILQAIENPLLFLDGPFLNAIELRCASLADIENQALVASAQAQTARPLGRFAAPAMGARSSGGAEAGLTALVWEVRSRAGRLQRLLDSASNFYSTCFSPHAAGGLDYGVHGEWGQTANPSHLAVDC